MTREAKYQLGVIGSFADTELENEVIEIAREIGREIARSGNVLVFGIELDGDSLSTQAALSAREEGGLSVAIAYGSKGREFLEGSSDVMIWTGCERGGPRESIFVLSCDGVISISGGSGTLLEMAIAYMNKRPVVAIEGTGGMSDKFAGEFLDHRKREPVYAASSAKEAVELIISLIEDRKSREILTYEMLKRTREFKSLLDLLENDGVLVKNLENGRVISLDSSKFVNIDQKMGLALFANLCFDTDMGLPAITVVENKNGRLEFLMKDHELVGFIAEKIIKDPFGKIVHYLDIGGVRKDSRSGGIGKLLSQASLELTMEKYTGKDIVVVGRTQNPMAVGMVKNLLPDGVKLAPFYADPSPDLIQSLNWLVETGYISRNKRKDSRFDGNKSMIYWGAYGERGDGKTWEDMTKFFKGEINWDLAVGKKMLGYLSDNNTDLEECLRVGHAFVIGAIIKNDRK